LSAEQLFDGLCPLEFDTTGCHDLFRKLHLRDQRWLATMGGIAEAWLCAAQERRQQWGGLRIRR
jgi:hypothetical protein